MNESSFLAWETCQVFQMSKIMQLDTNPWLSLELCVSLGSIKGVTSQLQLEYIPQKEKPDSFSELSVSNRHHVQENIPETTAGSVHRQ